MNSNSNKKKKKLIQVEGKSKKRLDKNGLNKDAISKSLESSAYEMSKVDTMLIAGFGVIVGSVYIFTMYPTISGGDSGELIAAAHEFGVAHPPGYPLFTMLAWLFINLIPFGTVAWRVNLLNALFAGLAAFFFTLTIYRYTKRIECALFGGSLWAFCKLTWTWSSNAEVFGLNNFFITSLLYLMVVFQDSKEENKEKVAYFGAFYCGLALCNQHTMIVYVIIVAAWVLVELKNLQKLSLTCLVKIGVCFLNGLVPYIYVPISAYLSLGRWTWGDQTSMEGFIKHLLRQEYGTFDLARSPNGQEPGMVTNLNKYVIHTTSEFTVFGVILFMIGILDAVQRFKKHQQQGLFVSFCMAFIYLMFFSWRANLDLTNELFLGVVERFWMQCDAVLVLLAAAGFSLVLKVLEDKVSSINIKIGSISISICVLALQLGKNFPSCNQRNNRIIEEFGQRIMSNLPKNTLLLQVGDLSSNLLRYQYLCEKYRPDISVLDIELMTYPWAVPIWKHKYPKVTFPGDTFYRTDGKTADGGVIFSFKTFLNANYHRPIITCIGMKTHEYIQNEGFELLPFGPCSVLSKQPVNLEKTYYPVIDLAQNVSEGWSHKYESQAPTSWERVAAGEMWNARVNIPLFLYYRAEREQNVEAKTKLLTKTYQMYKEVLEKLDMKDVPSYYHKNFALACDKMLNVKHDIPKAVILDEAIEHFSFFVIKDPTDKDVPAIRNIIENYKKYVGKI